MYIYMYVYVYSVMRSPSNNTMPRSRSRSRSDTIVERGIYFSTERILKENDHVNGILMRVVATPNDRRIEYLFK